MNKQLLGACIDFMPYAIPGEIMNQTFSFYNTSVKIVNKYALIRKKCIFKFLQGLSFIQVGTF